MHPSDVICPECWAGKHSNCNGVGGVSGALDNPIPCYCASSVGHPNRHPIVDSKGHILFDWDADGNVRVHPTEGLMVMDVDEPKLEARYDENVIEQNKKAFEEFGSVICAKCLAGKHGDCNGIGGMGAGGELLIKCGCSRVEHPNRSYFGEELKHPKLFEFEVPPNEPGLEEAAFPELFFDKGRGIRVKPDVTIIRDLMDVQVQNKNGEWVPAVPTPIFGAFGKRVRCYCKKWYPNTKRYQEHYAYAHILGMED